jgi:hypothetical protein
MKRLLLAAVLVLTGAAGFGVSGCVVRERAVARPGGCPGGYWVEGHRGYHGEWYQGHWRCPGYYGRY